MLAVVSEEEEIWRLNKIREYAREYFHILHKMAE